VNCRAADGWSALKLLFDSIGAHLLLRQSTLTHYEQTSFLHKTQVSTLTLAMPWSNASSRWQNEMREGVLAGIEWIWCVA
jgi:hypothetical protein